MFVTAPIPHGLPAEGGDSAGEKSGPCDYGRRLLPGKRHDAPWPQHERPVLDVVVNRTSNDDGIMFEYTCSRHHPKRFSFTTVALRDQR